MFQSQVHERLFLGRTQHSVRAHNLALYIFSGTAETHEHCQTSLDATTPSVFKIGAIDFSMDAVFGLF